ncbi:MAG: hypothetical protein LBM13_02550 [Candidatus Ancillula sp.]|jgi:hypothetical protein|nr:hypothetical protein [Candidatus Ancillula sp.]
MEILNTLSMILKIIGFVSVVFVIVGCILGVWRLIWRYGKASWKTKIFIVEKSESSKTELIETFKRSGMFRKNKKFLKTIKTDNLDELNGANIVVINATNIDNEKVKQILSKVNDNRIAIAVYCNGWKNGLREIVAEKQNSVLSNYRVRLINDVFTMMMTFDFGHKIKG